MVAIYIVVYVYVYVYLMGMFIFCVSCTGAYRFGTYRYMGTETHLKFSQRVMHTRVLGQASICKLSILLRSYA